MGRVSPSRGQACRDAHSGPAFSSSQVLQLSVAAVLFIDNQTTLTLGVQSIDLTLLKTNTEGLAKLAKMFDLPVVLTTTGGGAHGASGGLLKGITGTFPDVEPIARTGI
jgi:hypothetical protein